MGPLASELFMCIVKCKDDRRVAKKDDLRIEQPRLYIKFKNESVEV